MTCCGSPASWRGRGCNSSRPATAPAAALATIPAAVPPPSARESLGYELQGLMPSFLESLEDRMQQLITEPAAGGTLAWVIVDTCRGCENHSTHLRHDERNYMARYQHLKDTIERSFPTGVVVEPLVTVEASGVGGEKIQRDTISPVRVGAFEVFIISSEQLEVDRMAALPLEVHDQTTFYALCLASKLQARVWPAVDKTFVRLAAVMPRLLVRISVHTELGQAVVGVQLVAFPARNSEDASSSGGGALAISTSEQADNAGPGCTSRTHSPCANTIIRSFVVASGRTDMDGACKMMVPACMHLRIQANHAYLMEKQEREIRVTLDDMPLPFVAETVMQLWQIEKPNELVVFCSAPREARWPNGMVLFKGFLERCGGEVLRSDVRGHVRGWPHPFHDVSTICCPGWRPSPWDATRGKEICLHSGVVELARLGWPFVEVSVVCSLCGVNLPQATIYVDDKVQGTTGEHGVPLGCAVRAGEHTIRAEHWLETGRLAMSHSVTSANTGRVQLELLVQRLRFVCVGRAGVHEAVAAGCKASADLWIVGGDLDEWRCNFLDSDSEVWPWDGELCGRDASEPLSVRAGILNSTCELTRGGICPLTLAVRWLKCTRDPWKVVFHPVPISSECIVCHLARSGSTNKPNIWLAQLGARTSDGCASSTPFQMSMHVVCCGRGFSGTSIEVNREVVGTTNDSGEYTLQHGREDDPRAHIRLCQLNPESLSNGSNEYFVHLELCDPVRLEVACHLWVYWIAPELYEEEEADNDKEEDEVVEGTVWVSAILCQLPEEARPLCGTLKCPGNPEYVLDGCTLGPFAFRSPNVTEDLSEDVTCILSELVVHAEMEGHDYRCRDPSPFCERIQELGGCELQRLLQCPVVVGFLRPRLDCVPKVKK